MVVLTDQGLKAIEQYADKKKKADTLLMVQVLREVRELKALLKIHQNTCNCCNNCSNSTNNGKDEHS